MPSKDALQRLLDGLQTLFREHLALARLEIKEDVRSTGKDLLAGAAGVPALAAGYLLLMIAIGYLLALWMPNWAAFGIVALLNLGAGGGMTFLGVRKVMRKRVGMPKTGEELRADKEWLASLKPGARPADGDGKIVVPVPAVAGPVGVRGPMAPPAQPPRSGAVPAGQAGSTGGATGSLGGRTIQSERRQPEPGGTTAPNGGASVH